MEHLFRSSYTKVLNKKLQYIYVSTSKSYHIRGEAFITGGRNWKTYHMHEQTFIRGVKNRKTQQLRKSNKKSS